MNVFYNQKAKTAIILIASVIVGFLIASLIPRLPKSEPETTPNAAHGIRIPVNDPESVDWNTLAREQPALFFKKIAQIPYDTKWEELVKLAATNLSVDESSFELLSSHSFSYIAWDAFIKKNGPVMGDEWVIQTLKTHVTTAYPGLLIGYIESRASANDSEVFFPLLLEKVPQYAEFYIQKLTREHPDQAIELLQHLDPQSPLTKKMSYHLIQAYAATGEPAKALETCFQSLKGGNWDYSLSSHVLRKTFPRATAEETINMLSFVKTKHPDVYDDAVATLFNSSKNPLSDELKLRSLASATSKNTIDQCLHHFVNQNKQKTKENQYSPEQLLSMMPDDFSRKTLSEILALESKPKP